MIIARFLIAALAIFEALNFFGVLHFSLDFSWLGLIITSLGAIMIMESLYYGFLRKGIRLPVLPYIMVVAGLYIDALGDTYRLYSHFSWYDQFAHFWGGGAVMVVAIAVFSRLKTTSKLPLILMLVICLAFCALLGDLYEIEEYTEDLLRGYQLRLGSAGDTVNDIALNLLGGLTIGVLYFPLARRR